MYDIFSSSQHCKRGSWQIVMMHAYKKSSRSAHNDCLEQQFSGWTCHEAAGGSGVYMRL